MNYNQFGVNLYWSLRSVIFNNDLSVDKALKRSYFCKQE